jgi:hypothetical protein
MVKVDCENKRFYEWTGESAEFERCEWKNIRSSGYGGVIYINNVSGYSLSIDSCSFMNLSASALDGAVGCYYIGSFILTSSLLFNTSGVNTGGITAYYLIVCYLLHNCSFDSCFASSSNIGGVALGSFFLDSSCSNHSLFGTVFGCVFKQCEALKGDTGGLHVYSPPSSFSIRSCVFDECKAGGLGGGIHFSFLSYTESTDILLYYCFFQWK